EAAPSALLRPISREPRWVKGPTGPRRTRVLHLTGAARSGAPSPDLPRRPRPEPPGVLLSLPAAARPIPSGPRPVPVMPPAPATLGLVEPPRRPPPPAEGVQHRRLDGQVATTTRAR